MATYKITKEQVGLLKEHYKKLNNQNILTEQFINSNEQTRYEQRLFESYFITNDTLNEGSLDNQDILARINNNEFDVNSSEFANSLNSGNKTEFLTPYTPNELGKMKTFKVKGFNAGFAIKSDGDIVSVHNNSGLPSVGSALIKAAIKNGGNKLDHFDGYLTGFYSKLGFKVVGTDDWNDDYAPSNWKYEPIDIYNPNNSVYANELRKYSNENEIPDNLKAKIINYKEGKPDIIYRHI